MLLTERKIVSHHSTPVLMLMVHEARSETEKSNTEARQEVEKEFTLLVTPIRSELKHITVARQVVFMAMCEKPVLVSTKVAGLFEVPTHANVAKNHVFLTAKCIIGVNPVCSFILPKQILEELTFTSQSTKNTVKSKMQLKRYFTLKASVSRTELVLKRLKLKTP